LGLAIANRIVTAHGGIIEFKNRRHGGAEFTVVLPVGAERADTTAAVLATGWAAGETTADGANRSPATVT
jgi:hypothetical protein